MRGHARGAGRGTRGAWGWPRLRVRITFASTVLPLVTLMGCDGGGPEALTAPPFEVRDSAGIEIIENNLPEWGEGETWTGGSRAGASDR